jgi:hypothetical protein
MKLINAYERQQIQNDLNAREWNTSFNISQRDPTMGGIYLLLLEGSQCLEKKEPEIRYWFTCAYSEREKAHGHGVLNTTLTHRQVEACFSRGCNKPVMRDIYDKERLIDYQVKQAIEQTQITNTGE